MMRNGLIAVLLVFAVAGCSTVPRPGAPKEAALVATVKEVLTPCPHEAEMAVLDKLLPIFGGYEDLQDDAAVLQYMAKIKCAREFSNTIKDGCQRTEYIGWLDFFKGKAAEKRASLHHGGKYQSDEERRVEREKREAAALADYKMTHPVPDVPDSCSVDLIRSIKPDSAR